MGLPIYREPGETDSKLAPASLPEPLPRTAIRRQSTVRRARPALPHINSNVPTHHGPSRARLPPSAFFSFLRSNQRLQELYDQGTSRERSEMVDQFMRSRRLRNSELQRRQPSTSGTANADLRRRSTARSRRFDSPGITALEGEEAANGIPQSAMVIDSTFTDSNRPRSRRGYGDGPGHSSDRDALQNLTNLETQNTLEPQFRRRRVALDSSMTSRFHDWDHVQDPSRWETLLTTITPDPSLPSAESSFASAAASFQNETETPIVPERAPESSWEATYSEVQRSNVPPTPILISPPSSTSPPQRPLHRRQLPALTDHGCDSESEGSIDTDTDSDTTGNAGFVSLVERMIRTGHSTREINNELRDLPWGMISNSSIVSGARRELEILATGGEIPDSFWESAGLMTVLEHERRMSDARQLDSAHE